MKAKDTRIPIGGVFRCCLATVATELLNSDFELGTKSACMHCKRTFELKDSSTKDKEAGILGLWLPSA